MRQVDLVRYQTEGKAKVYRLKDKSVLKMLDQGEKLAEKIKEERTKLVQRVKDNQETTIT